MPNFVREELIKHSLDIRVLRAENSLFINILSLLGTCSFSCNEKDLDYYLQTKELQELCIITDLCIEGEKINLNSHLIKFNVNTENILEAELANGKKISCSGYDFSYEGITPTAKEYKELIYSNLEPFHAS